MNKRVVLGRSVGILVNILAIVSTLSAQPSVHRRWISIGHDGPIGDMQLSPDNRFLVSTDWSGGTVMVWDTKTNDNLAYFPSNSRYRPIAISPNAQTLAIGDTDLILVRSSDWTATRRIRLTGVNAIYRIQFSMSGDTVGLIASTKSDFRFYIIDLSTEVIQTHSFGHSGYVIPQYGFDISPSLRYAGALIDSFCILDALRDTVHTFGTSEAKYGNVIYFFGDSTLVGDPSRELHVLDNSTWTARDLNVGFAFYSVSLQFDRTLDDSARWVSRGTLYSAPISNLLDTSTTPIGWWSEDPGYILRLSHDHQTTLVGATDTWIKVSGNGNVYEPLNIARFDSGVDTVSWIMKQNGGGRFAVSPAQNLIAIASAGITLLDRDGKGAMSVNPYASYPTFNPDGSLLAYCSFGKGLNDAGYTVVEDLSNEGRSTVKEGVPSGMVTTWGVPLAFHPDGKKLLVDANWHWLDSNESAWYWGGSGRAQEQYNSDGSILYFRIGDTLYAQTSSTQKFFTAQHGMHDFRINAAETRLISPADDGTLVVLQLQDKQVLHRFNLHHKQVLSACYSPDETSIVAGCNDSTIVVIDAETGKETGVLRDFPGACTQVFVTRDGHDIIASTPIATIDYDSLSFGFRDVQPPTLPRLSLEVFPNPTSGRLTIVSDVLASTPEHHIIVRDVLGREIYETVATGSNALSVDLSSLPPGAYRCSVDGVVEGNVLVVK